MPRLLIITAWYFPFIHPRAHRWTVLAEQWAAQGFEVHVVCARQGGCSQQDMVNGVQVHRVGFDSLKEVIYHRTRSPNARGRVGAGVQRPTVPMQIAGWLYRTFWKNIFFPDDACLWYFPARKKVLGLLNSQIFDGIISVSLPFTGHLVGLAAKRQFPALRWVADIGDPFTIQAEPLNNALLYGRLSCRLERKILENADGVVVTNPAAAAAYRAKFGVGDGTITVIPPLLHPAMDEPGSEVSEEKADFTPSDQTALHIGYFGAFYAPVRTPDAFLDLLEHTFSRYPEWRSRLKVHFFGDVFPEFWEKLTRQPAIRLYGLRSRQEVRAAMKHMDILLNIGNVTDFQLPSKSAEYLASGKPVVHLSYLQNDPFVAFWGEAPGLFQIKVEKQKVPVGEVQRWVAFLERKPGAIPGVLRTEQVSRCLAPALGTAYISVLGIKP